MELRLLGWWNDLERHWSVQRGLAAGRRFVPEHEIPAPDSPEGIARAQLVAAMKLAQDGKFEEARRGLEKIIADHSGTDLETAAKLSRSKLETMKQFYDKAAKNRERKPR